MPRDNLTINVPDDLIKRMKGLGVINPARLVEVILGWVDDEHLMLADQERHMPEPCPTCTPVQVALPEEFSGRVNAHRLDDPTALVEVIVGWLKDDEIRDALKTLREQSPAQKTITQEIAHWIASDDMLDAPEIWEALRGDSPQERREASMILTEIGKPAVPGLVNLLHDVQSSTRLTAVRTLGEIADPSVVASLREALNDASETVRQAVVEALKRIGTPEALASVDAWKRMQRKSKM